VEVGSEVVDWAEADSEVVPEVGWEEED